MLITLTGCFSEKKSDEERLNRVSMMEEQLLKNAEKTENAKNNAVEEMLNFIEKDVSVTCIKNVRKKMARIESFASEQNSADKLNAYFDELDKMELTLEETKVIDEKVEKIEESYMASLPKPLDNVFEEGNVPEGISETAEAITIGGDIVIDKDNPENALMITNLVRSSEGMPAIDTKEAATRGFYSSQAWHMWGNDLWGKGEVKYRFTSSTGRTEENLIEDCMRKWTEASGGKIKFIRYKNNSWNKFRWSIGISKHVKITAGGPSESSFGEQSWAYIHYDRKIFTSEEINSDYTRRTVQHELGHTLGLFHEHQRPDRDNYITVNMEAGKNRNKWSKDKAKENYGKIEEDTYIAVFDAKQKKTAEYDYNSIMHYPSGYDGITKSYDILKKDGTKIKMATELSALDKSFIKELY